MLITLADIISLLILLLIIDAIIDAIIDIVDSYTYYTAIISCHD
jgi:hypothetical protein